MATCIFCSSADNLNTSLSITLDDGTKVDVAICDTHAEDATVKTVKNAYLDRQKQIDAVLAQAKALGIILPAPNSSGLVIAQQQAPVQPAQPRPAQPPPTGVSPLLEDEDGVIVPKSRMNRTMTSVGGSVGVGDIRANVPSYASHSLTENYADKNGHTLPEGVLDGQMRLVEVEGRAGMPLGIPAVIRDGTGTMRVRVVKTDDQSLQRRFKSIADASLHDGGPDYRHTYDQNQERRCPICQGSGEAINKGRRFVCPKCGGAGVI